jgi:hypothetical protein
MKAEASGKGECRRDSPLCQSFRGRRGIYGVEKTFVNALYYGNSVLV